jgi:hypothetical protein
MNWISRSLLFTLLLGLLWLVLPGTGRADTVYTYTGNAFDAATAGAPAGATSISITFVVAQPLIDMAFGPLTPESFSITDGANSITNTTDDSSGLGFTTFELSTGLDGLPDQWNISVFNAADILNLESVNQPGAVFDDSRICIVGQWGNCAEFGEASSVAPGSWSIVQSPEPSSLLLFDFGLLGLGVMAFWRKNAAESAGCARPPC